MTVVVAAGPMHSQEYWRKTLKAAAHVICADGGYAHLSALRIEPEIILGDFDSCTDVPEHIPRQSHPTDKDASDSQLAIEYAFDQGATEVLLLGGEGGRLDHTLANLSLLKHYPGKLRMADGHFEALAISQSHYFTCRPKQTCSLLPDSLSGATITTRGLRFGLSQAKLRPDSHGLSNETTGTDVTITVHEGLILLVRNFT